MKSFVLYWLMFWFVFALVFSFKLPAAESAEDSMVRVAVIDSGINPDIMKDKVKYGLCPSGHKDFTGRGMKDIPSGHGTNVSGLIHKYANGAKYCQVILKYYHHNLSSKESIQYMALALHEAIRLEVDIINISGGGPNPERLEYGLILRALDLGIKVVAAAGNEGANLNIATYYPAMYDERIIVVGNGASAKARDETSNYGDVVDVWEPGNYPKGAYENAPSLAGTSQSTAITTGKLIGIHNVQNWRSVKSKYGKR